MFINVSAVSGNLNLIQWFRVFSVTCFFSSYASESCSSSRTFLDFLHLFSIFGTSPFKTSLALQLKMLRLNSCLWGDAEEIVKILWYTETAYDAAKVRLQGEYGRDKYVR